MKKQKNILIGLMVLILCFCHLIFHTEALEFSKKNEVSHSQIQFQKLFSEYAILMDLDQQEVLAKYHSQKKMYPASLTKIMTVLLVIEHTDDYETFVTIPQNIYPSLEKQNASFAGFRPQETVTVDDLLCATLLASGAESAMTLANFIAGSEENFVDMMNEKAYALGMVNTHFMNCTGLHDKNHYTTMEDLAILLSYALQNEDFYTLFTMTSHICAPSTFHSQGLLIQSTLFQSLQEHGLENPLIIGGKTGYTPQARLCLASLAEIEGKQYIFISAKALGDHTTTPYHLLDALYVYQQIKNR